MWQHIAIGSLLVLTTTVVHAAVTVLALLGLTWAQRLIGAHLGRAFAISCLVVGLFLVSLFDALLWAIAYLEVGAIGDFESALYFSMVTFTTLGYGDVILGTEWRLLAAFEAANGIIIFGWSTALVVAYVQRLAPKRSAHG